MTKSLLFISTCLTIALFIVLYLVPHLPLAPVLLLWAGLYILTCYFTILKRFRAKFATRSESQDGVLDKVTRRRARRSIGFMAAFIVLLVLVLPFGILQDGPVFFRVVGAIINIGTIVVLVHTIRRTRKHLN